MKRFLHKVTHMGWGAIKCVNQSISRKNVCEHLQIPGGYLADRVSAKLMLAVSVVAPSVVTLLMPLVARWNVDALVALRVISGLASVSTTHL